MIVDATLKYDRGNRIGATLGANSEVYEIREVQLGGQMVVKEVSKAKIPDPTKYFEEAQRLFKSSHPNVVPIRYACESPTFVALVMPYYARGPLTDRISTGPLIEREVIRVGIGVLAGLTQIHAQNLVHFDVKPSNVLFDDQDQPRVADFGQSVPLSSLGTAPLPPLYWAALPPEAINLGRGSIQCDIYQAGLLLYRAVNGEPYHAAQLASAAGGINNKIKRGKFPDRDSFLPHISKRIRRVIRKALQVDPAKRYQTAQEMSVDLGGTIPAFDWKVALASGQITWRAARAGQPDLVVEMTQAGSSWGCAAFTEGSGTGRRAKNDRTFKMERKTETEVTKHLKDVVFPALA